MTDFVTPEGRTATTRSGDSPRTLLPETLRPRELLALPLYVVVVILYMVSVCFAFLADAIAGKRHSRHLFHV